MKNQFKYDVAISLASEHLTQAEKLRKELVRQGVPADRIFLYSHQGDRNIGYNLKQNLRNIYDEQACVVIVLLSRAYLANELTQSEWEAVKTRLPRDPGFMIPVRMEKEVMIKDLDEVQGYGDVRWAIGAPAIAAKVIGRLGEKSANKRITEEKAPTGTHKTQVVRDNYAGGDMNISQN